MIPKTDYSKGIQCQVLSWGPCICIFRSSPVHSDASRFGTTMLDSTPPSLYRGSERLCHLFKVTRQVNSSYLDSLPTENPLLSLVQV
jgi:hypothetical protein